jgi:hypothetical protein
LRRFILVDAGIEAVLKIAALVDLARRSPEDVHGSRARWAASIVLVNSVGALPITYFVHGRRRA